MKDQATHIRLIRNENGKPVEAEYCSFKDENDFDEYDFITWSEANRTPVTGDWPDREVFAMEEVEEQPQCKGLTEWYDVPWSLYHAAEKYPSNRRIALRLKAKQEECIEDTKQDDLPPIPPIVTPEYAQFATFSLDEPQNSRITVALVKDLLNQVTAGEISFSRMVEILRETQSSFAKQQYQQEIIEKLEAVESVRDFGAEFNDGFESALNRAIQVIKST